MMLGLRSRHAARMFSVSASAQKTAVMLMNMGGPAKVSETYDFLLRLFSDKDLIPLGPFQEYTAKFIAWRRYKTIEEHYEEIGGGSPILKYSEAQAQGACEILDKVHPSTAPHLPYVAFRYARPLTEETYQKMLDDGITRAIAFSQYPQYSFSTTRSNVNELHKRAKELDPEGKIQWSYIQRWPTHKSFINTTARHIRNELEKFPAEHRKEVMILFSAHSLPMTVVNTGDPYVAEVCASAYAVMQKLQFYNPYRVTWQSQVGPQPWLGAQTQRAIQTLEKQPDYKGVVVVPIAFTSDHIETLHEIDIEMREEVKRPELLRRSESLNGDPEFIQGLADMVVEHLDSDEASQIESGMAIIPVFTKLK